MKLFGITLRSPFVREKAIGQGLDRRGWWSVREAFPGAWQRNIEVSRECQLAFSAVYACVTRISNDIAKMPLNLVEKTDDGIWKYVDRQSPFWPVLRKPNAWQNRIKFFTSWLLSKLLSGNTYVLLERDGRGVPVAMHVLDPHRVQVKVTSDGRVFYTLSQDNLAGLEQAQVSVPASEIIHDLMNPLFHPLCGVSPLFAASLSASHGRKIQVQSSTFFDNAAVPSGLLTVQGELSDEQATKWSKHWNENFTGANRGKVAILGGGLQYQSITQTAEQAQLIEQLKWTTEDVARAFGVPLYKINAGAMPTSNNVEALNVQYFQETLQALIEAIEICIDEALGLGTAPNANLGTEFDLDVLLRMDQTALFGALEKGVGSGIQAPNEARRRLNLPPVSGGSSPYLQMQNFSLEALAKRDAQADPFNPVQPASEDPDALDASERAARDLLSKAWRRNAH